MINYKSPKRFSERNNTKLDSNHLKEQLESIDLPDREPQSPTTHEIFGSDERRYQPSQFLLGSIDDAQIINSVEYAGSRVSFSNLVKALSKKITEGTAKPERAAAYSEYFTYLGKVLAGAITSLETAKKLRALYLADKVEFDAIYETYREQLKYEQNLSAFDWKIIELEEQQVRQNAQLEENNVQLKDELEEVKLNQGKLKSVFKKFMNLNNIENNIGENK